MAEEEDQQSLGAAVQMIMETMSDSVSQLVLLVITLQEQNAALPPGLPPAATAVAGASATLTEVVRALADEEYNDFPEIRVPILKAADDTDSAATGLVNAVEVIKTMTDRKSGWNGLMEACRVISGNTIRVLQLVYGAQLRRLLYVADLTLGLMDGVDVALIKSDPQRFADMMGELVGKVADLGAYALQKAADEDSPVTREEYKRRGEELTSQSDELLAVTNELLQDCDNAALHQKFLDTLQKVQNNVQSLKPTITEQISQLADEQGTEAQHKEGGYYGPPLADSLTSAERTLGQLTNAIIHSYPAEIAESLKLLSASICDIADYCAYHTNDTEAQKRLAELQAALPELIMHARKALDGEVSDETRAQITADIERIRNCLDTLGTSCIEPAEYIAGVIERELATLDSLAESASVQDAQNVVANLKRLAATQSKLLPLVTEYAAGNAHHKDDLDEAIAELEALLPQNVTAAKGLLQEPSNIQSQHKLYEVINIMRAPLHAVASVINDAPYRRVSALQSRQHANAVLLHSATTAQSTIAAAQAILSTAEALALQARRIAESSTDAQARARLEREITALMKLLEAQAATLAQVEADPKNEEARKRLHNVSDILLARTSALADDLRDVAMIQDVLRQAVANKNTGELEAALHALDERIADTTSLARAAIAGSENDDNSEWLRSSLAVLDDALIEQRRAARVAVATGDSTAMQSAMDNVANQVAMIRSQSTKQVVGKSSHERLVDNAVDTCIKAIDQIESSSNNGDPNNAAAAARALVDGLAVATQNSKEAAQTKDAETQESITEAITQADAKVAALLLATRQALNNQGDQVVLSLAAEDSRRALGGLANAVVTPPEELLTSAQRTHRARTKAFQDVLTRHKDGKATDAEVAKALRDTIESAKMVLEALQAMEKDKEGSTHGAVAKVEKHLAALLAAEKAMRDASGARAQKAGASAVLNAEQISKDADAAMLGKAPEVVNEARHMEKALDKLSDLLSDASSDPAMNELVNHERALEAQLKLATASLPAEARSMGASLAQALHDDLLTRAVECVIASAKDPSNSERRLAALAAVAEVKAVTAALATGFGDVYGVAEPDAKIARSAEAAQTLSEMIPDLVQLSQMVANNPSAEANKRLAAAMEAIEGSLATFICATEGGKEKEDLSDGISRVQTNLGKMAEATRKSDVAAVVEAVKAVATELPVVLEQANQLAGQDEDNEEAAVVKEVVVELAQQLPEHIETSKKFLKKAKKDVLRSTSAMANNLTQLRTHARPKPSDKVVTLTSRLDKQSNELAKLPATGNKDQVANALRNIKRNAGQLREEAEKTQPEFLDPKRRARVAAAIAQLEARIQGKDGGPSDLETSANALTSDPNNAMKQKNFRENLKFFQDACTGVEGATRGPNNLRFKTRKETQQINSLARAARAGDAKGVVQCAREAAATQMEIEAQANPANSGRLTAAADKLEKNLSQCVVAAKGVLQDPNNSSNKDALTSSVADITSSLAAIAVATSPDTPLAEIEATAADQSAVLLTLRDNPNEAQMRKATENQAKLNELVKKESSNPQVSRETAAALAEELSDLNRTIETVESAMKSGDKEALSTACMAAQTPLSRMTDTAQAAEIQSNEETPEVVQNAKDKAQVLIAAIRGVRAGKMDPSKLLNSSQKLARTLSELVGQTKVSAYLAREGGNLTDTAEKALALDELLSSLATVGAPIATSKPSTAINSSMDSLISSIGNEQLATVTPPVVREVPLPAPEPKPKRRPEAPAQPVKQTLDESLKQVASEIRAAPIITTPSGAPSTTSTTSHSLATELERLAHAAQHNKRQDILVCGRSIAVLVNQICESMRQTAKESTNPLVQDKLFKSSQALKNFAIQLKILASVKAASTVDDSDADEQLGTLTRALGAALGEGFKAIDIHIKTTRKSVK